MAKKKTPEQLRKEFFDRERKFYEQRMEKAKVETLEDVADSTADEETDDADDTQDEQSSEETTEGE